ncbi:type IV pilus secretin PilQ [Saccharobesus litoralis]|uniref:Type IV pilus secretin PilQ n=1 Tax=Saccharobesus litoralis TaxID=2172099 RepID=A0A2S0VQN4_9ALTE|nr:type IV pilus secretin PilQ family protein [Saccharobesus litoralis]AWB66492.1 type IV pilus secretin PilQ [Saccharobesus litoralis]
MINWITSVRTALIKCVAVCGLALLPLQAYALSVLYEIRYNPVVAGETELEFVFDQELEAEPKVQVFSNPARIEVEIKNADFESYLTEVPVNIAGVENIKTSFEDETVRIKILLDALKVYQTRLEGERYFVHVSDNASFEKTTSKDTVEYLNKIQAMDFRHGMQDSGRVLVFLEDNMAAVDVIEKNEKVIIDFHNTDILPDLLYKMDVTDFGTVVDSLETFKDGALTRIEITTNRPFKYQYQQLENIFTIEVTEDKMEGGIIGSEQFEGDPISLNFQDIPVRTVLQIIADYNGFNLVTSDSVAGNITLRLDGVPWDQALDIILKIKGLDKRMEGNILLVAPGDEIAAREARELQAKKQVAELAPLYTEYLQVNYAKALEIASLLKGKSAMLSERGSLSVDERTNTLLLRDTTESINNIKRLVAILDIPVKQVMIESRIVTVKDNITDEMGIRWGISDQQGSDGISGSLNGAEQLGGGAIPSLNDRLNVNLPVAAPTGSIAFHVARLTDGTILDLELSALERENKGEVIASPRITTANQKTAYIEQGTEIPFVQAASSGATAVTFKKAVLSLEVTPQITPDNKIILDLIITQDSRGDTVQTATGSAVAIDTQEIGTQVLVDNGETIVLGGIYQQSIVNSESKVPLLGDIPYLGRLFKNTSDFTEKKELLIFVTPRVVTEAL